MYVCTKYVHFYVYVSQHGGPSEKDRGTSTLPYPTLTAGIGVGTLQYQYRSILPAPANVRLHLQYTSILRRVIYWYIYQVYIYILLLYIIYTYIGHQMFSSSLTQPSRGRCRSTHSPRLPELAFVPFFRLYRTYDTAFFRKKGNQPALSFQCAWLLPEL